MQVLCLLSHIPSPIFELFREMKLGVLSQPCNPYTWEAEAVGQQFQASQGYTVKTSLKRTSS
jgi:hypothetical protein